MSRLPSPPPEPTMPAAPKETDVTVLDSRIPVAPPAPEASPAPVARTSGGPRDPGVRLEALFDPGSLALLTEPDTSGVLAGTGTIDGMTAVAFASDPRIQGGAMGAAGCEAIVVAYDYAIMAGAPVIGLWHSGGARLREDVDMERLGGPEPHSRRSGVVHLVTATDAEALSTARRLALLLGQQGTMPRLIIGQPGAGLPAAPEGRAGPVGQADGELTEADLASLLPESRRRAYDVHPLISGLLDEPGIELHPRWAPNVVTTLGRLAGRTVGVIANNPLRLGGCLDA